jgi:cysteinyl-tRNA synthetase
MLNSFPSFDTNPYFRYEKEFFADMQKLGVGMPDVLVRVSEYVPQVIEMVQKIIHNGFAYVTLSFYNR